ncbi:MAG: lysophospholipid acyltransferase family protein [Flavobacteriales bacterium]
MKYVINVIRLICIVISAGISSTLGIIVLLFTFSTDRCINTAVTLFSTSVFFICGVKLITKGGEGLTKTPGKIYVSNHESHLDPPAITLACPHTLYFIAKKELKYVPFIGWYIWLSGMIFIDRKNRTKAQQSIQQAADKVRNGKNVISFPEGTRTKTGELMVFRRGAFKMAKLNDLEIVPIAIKGSREVLASGSMFITPGVISVNIGEVISPEEYKDLSVEQLANYARERVKALREEIE